MAFSISRTSKFYTKKLSVDIDSAIQGVTANDASQLLFSTANPNNGVSPVYTRSATCWAKNIDTSPTSVWTDGNGGDPRYNANMMTLISPRHGVVANHWESQIPGGNWANYIGAKFIFVAMDNTCYIRTFTGSAQVGTTDIRVVLLDSDLPPNISFCKVASSNLASVAAYSNRMPAMFQSYFPLNLAPGLRAAIADYYEGAVVAPANATRAAFNVTPFTGDSGRPTCFVYDNKLILLVTFVSPSGGANLPNYIEEINSAMTALGGGYTLSIFNKEDVISQEKNFSIKKQNLSLLKPQEIYTYKSSDIKIIINVFQILAGGYTLNVYEGGINGQNKTFFSGGEGWKDINEESFDGYIIPVNSVITFTGPNNIVVGNGAIIQKYNSGKIIASKLSSYSLSISNIGSIVFPGDENGRFAVTFTVPDLIRSYIISYQVEVIDYRTWQADIPTFGIFTTNLAISQQIIEAPCYLALRIRGVGRQPNSFTAWSPIFTYGAIGPGCDE